VSYEESPYWSNHESVKENIQYELRMKIFSLIEEEIRGAVLSGFPPAYVNGMEYVKTLVLDMQNKTANAVVQPTLL
jgi:hypothetical protein